MPSTGVKNGEYCENFTVQNVAQSVHPCKTSLRRHKNDKTISHLAWALHMICFWVAIKRNLEKESKQNGKAPSLRRKSDLQRWIKPRVHGTDWRRSVTGRGTKWRWQSANQPQLGLCWGFNWSFHPASPLTAADSPCRAAAQLYRLQSCSLQGFAAAFQTLSALTLSYRWDIIYFSIKKCLPRHI